jgi:ethanolamine utilization protein EutQ (cupin superfamily)
MAVDDVMVVLEGRLSVSGKSGSVTAGPGEIVHMPKGQNVTICSHEQGAVTAYVTYPHWQEARGKSSGRRRRLDVHAYHAQPSRR